MDQGLKNSAAQSKEEEPREDIKGKKKKSQPNASETFLIPIQCSRLEIKMIASTLLKAVVGF